LAVFERSFDLEQVEQVIPAPREANASALDGLYELAERSLLMQIPNEVGGVRFGMLETVRARARSHLDASGEAANLQERHARAYADLAKRAAGHIPGSEQAYWLDRLAADEPNLRAAARFAIDAEDVDTASALVGDTWRCWLAVGRLAEAGELVRQIESLSGSDAATPERLRL
jgi:predicted ATPase